MTEVIHPNFQVGPGQTDIENRTRAVMIYLPQSVYDQILSEVDHCRAESANEVITRAIARYFASLNPSDSN